MVDTQNEVRVRGVMADGYGQIPKMVMQDLNLTIEAKAIYAYLASYAGAGSTAFPGISITLKHLGISKDRYYRHRKLLVERGYISVQQTKSDNSFMKNVYTLEHTPFPYYEDTQNKDTQNEDTQIKDTQNKDTNINSSNINNINNNSIKREGRSEERKKPVNHQYGEFKNVLLTDDEYQKLKDRFPNDLNQRIERLSDYVASTGKSYKSHYATIISWANRDKSNKPQNDNFQNTRNSQEDTEITPEMMKAYEELKQNERA